MVPRGQQQLPTLRACDPCECRFDDACRATHRHPPRGRGTDTGGAISETVGRNLIDGVTITPLAVTTGVLLAATFMALGVYSGSPVPAALARTGAMIGVWLSLGGAAAFDTYRRIGTFWLLVPPTSAGLAYLTARLLRRDDVPDTLGITLLAGLGVGILATVPLGIIPGLDRPQGTVVEAVSVAVGRPALFGVGVVSIRGTGLFAVAGFHHVRRRTQGGRDWYPFVFCPPSAVWLPSPAAGAWSVSPRVRWRNATA